MTTAQSIVLKLLFSKFKTSLKKVLFYTMIIGSMFSLSNCIDEYRMVNITSVDIEVEGTSVKNPKVGEEIGLEGSYTYKGAGHHSDFKWTITDPTSSESWTIEKPRLILKPEISGEYKIELEVFADVDEFFDHESTDISLIINP